MAKHEIQKIEETQKELDMQLGNVGLFDENYDPKKFCAEAGQNIKISKKSFYEAAKRLWYVRKKEPYKDFVLYSAKYAGIKERAANFYAQTFEESLRMCLSLDQVNELGQKKIHALYQEAPPEAIEEYKDKGTILDVSPAQLSINDLKDHLKAYESNTAYQLEEETNHKKSLIEEIRQLKIQNKELQQYKNARQTGVFEFKAEHVFNKIIVSLDEALYFLRQNPIDNDIEEKLAQSKFRMFDDKLIALQHLLYDKVEIDYTSQDPDVLEENFKEKWGNKNKSKD
jgi:hypothetical protein